MTTCATTPTTSTSPACLRHTETLEFRLALDSYDARENLLAMTPHGWRVNPERRARILAEPFEVSVAVRYDWLQRD